MTGVKSESGATAATVAHNIAEQRIKLGLTYTQLSRFLTHGGHDIPPLGLRRIETGKRRVDVDDLTALALALDVSPVTLMMPRVIDPEASVTVTGSRTAVAAKRLWSWLNASYPLNGAVMGFYSAALPAWERDDLEGQMGTVKR